MAKFCESCGTKTDATDKFCTACGASIRIDEILKNESKKSPEVKAAVSSTDIQEPMPTVLPSKPSNVQIVSAFSSGASTLVAAPTNKRTAQIVGGVVLIAIGIFIAIASNHNTLNSPTLNSADSTSSSPTLNSADSTSPLIESKYFPFTPESFLNFMAIYGYGRTPSDLTGPAVLFEPNSSVLWYNGNPFSIILFYPTAADMLADYINLEDQQGDLNVAYCQNLWVSYFDEYAAEAEQAIENLISQVGVADCGPTLGATGDLDAIEGSNSGASTGTSDAFPADSNQPDATGSIG